MLEAATLKDYAGAEPLLLLDDPFAELDIHRAAKILLMLEKRGLGQTILAVPREADIPPGLMQLDRLSVRDGAVNEMKVRMKKF
jgi:DNA replication and repair protein RecF